MTDLTTLGIAEAGRLMARGEITSTALTEAFLKRIEAIDHKIASYVTVTADLARNAARQADMEMKGGVRRGALHGIPIALKDIYETAGVKTTGHSHLKVDYVPAIDAETVRRLKDAGAVILGKLGTHEFANGAMTPDQPFPAVLNPWSFKHQPGGSSSGSGAALAAQLCMGAMGSDTGGSIRNPAGYCATAGIKPTYGLVSRCGIFPLSFSMDTVGPMAWTTEDCALMLDVLAGHDPLDQGSAKTAKVDYGAAAHRPIKGMRIALARHWYEGENSVTPEMKKGIDEAVRVLKDLGAIVEDARIRPAADYHATITSAAASSSRPRRMPSTARKSSRRRKSSAIRRGAASSSGLSSRPSNISPHCASAASSRSTHARRCAGTISSCRRTNGAIPKSSRNRSRSSTSSASPRSACRSTSPDSPPPPCAAASPAAACRWRSSWPAAPSTKPA